MKPLALVDLDGTLADFDVTMREHLELLMSPAEDRAWLESMYEDTVPAMKARRRLIKRQPGFWRNLKRLERGFEIVQELRYLDFNIHVLTKAPKENPGAWKEKIEWCQEHLPGVPCTISDDKSLVYGRVLVDDWPPYYLPWLEHRPRGLVVAVAQPWNVDGYHPNVLRYQGGQEALSTLRERLREAKERAAGSGE